MASVSSGLCLPSLFTGTAVRSATSHRLAWLIVVLTTSCHDVRTVLHVLSSYSRRPKMNMLFLGAPVSVPQSHRPNLVDCTDTKEAE